MVVCWNVLHVYLIGSLSFHLNIKRDFCHNDRQQSEWFNAAIMKGWNMFIMVVLLYKGETLEYSLNTSVK